ncbi:MAG TPA: enoyl-CoA hydratase-related protein [Candidatus Bathyarchaeia archaeon]|nr:enoyl-CoA hydratase-related protein [Candidatus Bathyarchaeia archaeon]
MSALSYIQTERRLDDIAIITINRPDVLNAINVDVITELSSAIDTVSADDSIKVVIITGKGERSFCAGADIRYVVNINPIEAEKYASSVHTMLNKIENLEKPVIAAINGYALGGGCEIALACDIRVASANAKIGQTEVKIGIPPGWGGSQRMLRILGPAKAKELIFTGEMITADEALKIGLVNKVVSLDTKSDVLAGSHDKAEERMQKIPTQTEQENIPKVLNKKLMDECVKLGKEITKNSYNAVKVSKMLIDKGMDADLETGLRLEIYGWALCFAHEDRNTMMSAFLNRGKR